MNELMIKNIAHTVGGMSGTMSSVEIARLTGKDHANVMRDIRQFLDAIGQSEMASVSEAIYLDSYGREKPMYNLPKRECLGLAARYNVTLQMAIIDRWIELERKDQASITQTSPRESAIKEWSYETTSITDVLSKLGYSQGYLRKEALEIGFRIEGETGIDFVPKVLTEDPQATDPQELSEYTGTHAAYAAKGSIGSTASNIAQVFGHDITPTMINDILIAAKLQVRIASGKYQPTERGKMLCNVVELASGKMQGTTTIKDWLYNHNKKLRDIIADGVVVIRSKRANPKTNVKLTHPLLTKYNLD